MQHPAWALIVIGTLIAVVGLEWLHAPEIGGINVSAKGVVETGTTLFLASGRATLAFASTMAQSE